MPEITLRHEVDCDEDTFWTKIVFDEAFNKQMYEGDMKFPSWKLLESKDSGDKIQRKVFVDPPAGDLPGPIKKALGNSLAYTEEGTFDKTTKRYTFKVTPAALADKTKINGELWAEKIGDKKMRRMCKINVEVKVMLVGGMIQDRILQDLQKSYDTSTIYTNKYIKEHGL